MFLIDDLLLRSVGLSLKPFDLIWVMELLRDYTLREKYNLTALNNQIKENRLLFELGEIGEEEYTEKHLRLLEELEEAKEVQEKLSNVQITKAP